jgi:hypothetical protein
LGTAYWPLRLAREADVPALEKLIPLSGGLKLPVVRMTRNMDGKA